MKAHVPRGQLPRASNSRSRSSRSVADNLQHDQLSVTAAFAQGHDRRLVVGNLHVEDLDVGSEPAHLGAVAHTPHTN